MKRNLIVAFTGLVALASFDTAVAGLQSNDGRSASPVILRPEYIQSEDRIPNILPGRSVKKPRVALVFSGGGVRGISGVGVLKSFEKNGIPVNYIVGTSIGAIVGGLYACGYSVRDLENLVATTDWANVLSYSDESERRDLFLDQKLAKDRSSLIFRFQGFEPVIPSSYSSAQRLTNYLNILTLQGIFHPNPSFDDLKIPFRVVTTDLVSGRRVVIDRGDLAEALRAAVSVPLLFSPVVRDTMQLMDGGLVSNIPVDVAREMGADIVIAIDATSPLRTADQLKAPWEVADQIIAIMMQSANREQLKLADVVVKPDLGNHLASDFTGLDSLIRAGEKAGDEAAPAILRLLTERREWSLKASTGNRVFPSPRVEFDPSVVPEPLHATVRRWQQQPELSEGEVIFLLTQMYDTGEYADVYAEAAPGQEGTLFHIRGEFNPVLTGVQFVGNKELPADTLLQPFLPLIGKRVNTKNTSAAIEEILGIYRDRGYSLARVQRASFDASSGNAVIVIDEGIIERREIKGTKKTKDYVLWREMPLKGREVFQVSKAAESIRNLYSTNLFEQVVIGIRDDRVGENIHHIVEVRVRERPTELIRLSLRIDNERSVQPSIDIRDENFLGIGSELGVSAFGGLRNRFYSAGFKAMRIFNSYLTFDLKGFYSLRDAYAFRNEPIADPARWKRVRNGEFREIKSGWRAAFGSQLERLGTVSVEGRLEDHELKNIDSNPIVPSRYRIASFRVGTRVDTQDEFPFPTDGIALEFFYESAIIRVKDGIGFSKFYFDYLNHRSIARGHVISSRLTIGSADETLPFTEQFQMGGQKSFYGLREDNSRGRQLFVASLEYRYRSPFNIFFDTYVAFRYDLGSIWEVPEQIRVRDLRHGIGISIALDTPLGPAEFAVGRSFYFRKELLDRPLSVGPLIAYFTIGYSL